MSKPARGTKRVCQSCGARFYDLSRTPIVCPVCQAVYQIAPPPTRRGERAAPVEARVVVAPDPKIEVITRDADVVSLEEVDEGAEDVVIEDEEAIDIGEEPEIPPAGDEDAFLEEPETDEGTDVTGIVSPGKGEEG